MTYSIHFRTILGTIQSLVHGISFPELLNLILQVIADNVGDNVGDIAGMGSDLFGSYAESSCAALVVASISSFGIDHDFTGMCYPLLVSSVGIIVCLITTLFATDFFEVKAVKEIEPALKKQLIISTVLMTVGIAVISWLALPAKFTIYNFGIQKAVSNWYAFFFVNLCHLFVEWNVPS